MQMSDIEIVDRYKRADNKKEQAKILAELNACGEEIIVGILRKNDVDVSELERKPRGRQKKKLTELVNAPLDDSTVSFNADDEPIGITGGEGVTDINAESQETTGRYKTGKELKAIPEDRLTEQEKERLKRVQLIPDTVVELVENELCELTSKIMELERKHDELVDYMNGELRCRD